MTDPQDQAQKNSILDRVMLSQHAAAIEHFVPVETFDVLAKNLTEKERDVIRRRYGLHGQDEETLEQIGKRYVVTRERIRQIENAAVAKMHQAKGAADVIRPVERLLVNTLTTHGGVMEEQAFLQHALTHAGSAQDQRRALQFLLTRIFRDAFEYVSDQPDFRPAWKLRAQSFDLARRAVAGLIQTVTAAGAPIAREKLIDQFRSSTIATEHAGWFTDDVIQSYLGLSSGISRNPFGEYGLSSWGMIVPKRMNDKIFLVLSKHGKPLHFTEITRLINEAGFDHRQAYPPTVHNELILNPQYVLVGRGIYALKDWGFKPGVVADVIVSILKASPEPLDREKIIATVLEQRFVKRNTVLLALTNKKLFHRLDDGRYALASSPA